MRYLQALMGAEENRSLIESLFAGKVEMPELLADDAIWYVVGIGTFKGKIAILSDLFGPIYSQLASMGHVEATSFVADGDKVVVEATSVDRETVDGEPFNMSYCIVFRLGEGKILEVAEYGDTALFKSAFPEIAGDA